MEELPLQATKKNHKAIFLPHPCQGKLSPGGSGEPGGEPPALFGSKVQPGGGSQNPVNHPSAGPQPLLTGLILLSSQEHLIDTK